MTQIRIANESDLAGIAAIHEAAFVRQHHSEEWIKCNLNAYPLKRLFIVEIAAQIVGYIMWGEKSGFRKEAVIELEQIAVCHAQQGKGIGTMLILKSFEAVQHAISERGAIVKSVLVTTRADNLAQRVYKKALGVEVIATISAMYSADEVIMMALVSAKMY
jgi:ribosomal protein S18 acetylase RimI-like enzyme